MIEGTGDSEELLIKLSKTFKKLNPSITIIIPRSIGSGGGIQKIIDNKCKLCRTARNLKAGEKNKGLKQIIFAYSPIVFAVNNNTIKENLAQQNIIDIFSGKIIKFDDIDKCNASGKIYVIRRESGDSSLNILENTFKEFKNIKKYAGKITYSNSDTKNYLLKYKNTIGYLPLPNIINTKLKILNINNIAPTKENILNSKYKLVTPFGLVYKGDLEGIEKRFVQFLKTKVAKNIMQNFGVVSTFQ